MTDHDTGACNPREAALLGAALQLVNEVNHSLANRGHGWLRYNVLSSSGPEHLLPELPDLGQQDARTRATTLLQDARLTSLTIALLADALGTTTEHLLTGAAPRQIARGFRITPQDPDRPEMCPNTLLLADTLVCCERPFNHEDIHEAKISQHSYLRWSYAGRRVLPLTGKPLL